jgi:hypothetical protein
MPDPFRYPAQVHVRRHGPCGYKQYGAFGPWLRDEFEFRCVFCLRREQWDRASSLEIDHFRPASHEPSATLEYDNLFYVCARCNSAKADRLVASPIRVLLAETAWVEPAGQLIGQTDAARKLIVAMRLNHPKLVHFRRLWLEVIAMAARFDPELYQQLMGYPDDLPDLARLRPPKGNTRPAGVSQSHFARRDRGELPTIY